jgi:hypothetical protein
MATLDQNIGWTEQLGELVLSQPGDVADSIQRLRQRAQEEGTLASTPEAQVNAQGSDLVITPTNTDVVYVPVYTPDAVYGPWSWTGAGPMVLSAPPGGTWVGPIYWCAPVLAAGWLWATWDWPHHGIGVNLPRYNNPYNPHLASPVWGFVPAHRRGVPFRAALLKARYPDPGRVLDSADAQRALGSVSWQPAAATVRSPIGRPAPGVTAFTNGSSRGPQPGGSLNMPPSEQQPTRPAAIARPPVPALQSTNGGHAPLSAGEKATGEAR